jgi:hypothetical protein
MMGAGAWHGMVFAQQVIQFTKKSEGAWGIVQQRSFPKREREREREREKRVE